MKSGAKVIIWDNDENELLKASKNLNNKNLTCNVVDVSNYNLVDDTVRSIMKTSNIDILINNAGITGSTAPLWEYNVEEWKKIVDINLIGTFNC